MSGSGGIGGLGQAAGLEPGQRPRTGYQYQPGRFGELGNGKSRRCLTFHRLIVFHVRVDTQEDQRDSGVPFVLELRPLLDGPRAACRATASSSWPVIP